MDWTTALTNTIAAFLTLSIFSFLYKDNPFYKFAEHLMVGISAGYWMLVLIYSTFVDKVVLTIADGKWWYIIPTLLGVLMLTRFSQKLTWISRYPLALVIGTATGVAIPLEMKAKIIEQLYGSIDLVTQMQSPDATFRLIFDSSVILIGVVTALVYFFFSKAHTGATGFVAKIGIGVLMIGFGASFGFTVMARVSLLIQRLQFLMFDWLNLPRG